PNKAFLGQLESAVRMGFTCRPKHVKLKVNYIGPSSVPSVSRKAQYHISTGNRANYISLSSAQRRLKSSLSFLPLVIKPTLSVHTQHAETIEELTRGEPFFHQLNLIFREASAIEMPIQEKPGQQEGVSIVVRDSNEEESAFPDLILTVPSVLALPPPPQDDDDKGRKNGRGVSHAEGGRRQP
ncbi:hypothetical protein Pfo_003759, partial [Paulownia fortunei]